MSRNCFESFLQKNPHLLVFADGFYLLGFYLTEMHLKLAYSKKEMFWFVQLKSPGAVLPSGVAGSRASSAAADLCPSFSCHLSPPPSSALASFSGRPSPHGGPSHFRLTASHPSRPTAKGTSFSGCPPLSLRTDSHWATWSHMASLEPSLWPEDGLG